LESNSRGFLAAPATGAETLNLFRFFLMVLCLISIAITFPLASPPHSSVQQRPPALSDLFWLAGNWETTGGGRLAEEHWMAPGGNLMLGMSRTVAGDQLVSFEFLRVEPRDDGSYYVAQVRRRPGVDFRLATASPEEAVFVNPGHADHLKRIVY
jgi:hypothetical protein